jgi:ABC-type spermidine/putrescine transport system permease subunit I
MQEKKYKKRNNYHNNIDVTTLIILLLFIMAIAATLTVCFIVIQCSITEFKILLQNHNYNPHTTKEFTRYIWNAVSATISSIIVYCLGVKQGQKRNKKEKD